MVVLSPEGPAAVGVMVLTRTLRSRMVRVMNLPSWVIVVLCLLTQARPSGSADRSVAEKRRSYLITGVQAEREKLRSGQVVMTGEHWSTWPALGTVRLSVRFDVYFDHDSRSYRYTQRDYVPYVSQGLDPQTKARFLARTDLPHGTTPEGVEWVTTGDGGTVVHTPEYDLYNSTGHPHVTRQAPGTVEGYTVREWDLVALGLLDWQALDGGFRLNDILNAYETVWKCHSVETNTAGMSCLKLRSEWNPKADSVEYEIWIDEKQGMTPISIARKDLNDSLKEKSRSDVGWKKVNGVMVPVSFRVNIVHKPEYTEGYDLTLEWSHVNEPLDPKVFTPAGITESPGAMVADMRLGQIVVERVHPLPIASPKLVHPKPSTWLGWIVLGHLIAGGGFAWWYHRRRAKRQSA